MTSHESRIPVPGDDVARLLPLIAPNGREPARTMAVLARQPDLLSPFLGWAAALLRSADELHTRHDIGDATWAAPSSHFQLDTLVEVLYVVGQYTMLSMVANAAGITAPDGSATIGIGGAA